MLKLDWNLLWTVVNLIILFLLLKKFLFGPVCKIMDEREAKIKADLDTAKEEKEKAKKIREDYEKSIKGAREEATEITKAAKARAEKSAENTVKEAKEQSAKIIKEAQASAVKCKEQALQEAQSEIARLAIMTAGKVAEKNIDAADDEAFAKEFLREVGAAK